MGICASFAFFLHHNTGGVSGQEKAGFTGSNLAILLHYYFVKTK